MLEQCGKLALWSRPFSQLAACLLVSYWPLARDFLTREPWKPRPGSKLEKTAYVVDTDGTQSLITHKTRLIRDDNRRQVRPERVDAVARLRGDDVDDGD